ncbi:phosphotransferase [Croceicoccus sp. BE223]|uniref:phosphotransferase n=1 Tax=Croceicoccus sp. BE223 TaxID=2817716 RepID=UPI00285EF447|nr:phosphotransferase [Croceicoccus sp. BE223]MDR7103633.1 Ser/Thr protein kinase RdoA (MazF antagonist) [Croceicoccus sp. BE223]
MNTLRSPHDSGAPPADGSELSADVPELTAQEASALAERLFGIAGSAHLLTSERDRNFRLAGADGANYLLKISNPSEPDSVVDLQTACLDHVRARDGAIPVPRVLRTLAGKTRGRTGLADGRHSTVRMLTYLEGLPVKGTAHTREQRRAMGAALAELDLALDGFSHPGASHDLLWNVSRADRLAHLVADIVGDERRGLVRHFMDRFVDDLLPRLDGLRRQVIHNDFNLYNVLVDENDTDRVTGIIDFGDLIHGALVGEVATAATYQMKGAAKPLAAAAEFIGAYHEVLPLLPEEQAIVADLVATRQLVTVLITEWRSRRHPENHDYIMRHNPAAWDGLAMMADISREDARDQMLACVRNGDNR